MKIWVVPALLFVLILVAGNSFANGALGSGKIVSIHQRECSDGKGFQIVLANDHLNPDQCPNPRILEIPCNHPAFNVLVSLSMMAFATETEISGWVSNCDFEGQAKVLTLTLNK